MNDQPAENVVKLDDKRTINTDEPKGQVTLDSEKGKQTIENLLKTLPPEEAAKLQAALNSPNPPHIHVDENQNVFIGEAADKAVEMRKQNQQPRQPTKIDMKRIQAFEERIKRWVNTNADKLKDIPPEQHREKAIHALHAEDLDKMPVDKKLKLLEQVVFQTFNKLAVDVQNIEHNQYALADAMDVNLRALAKMINRLGIPVEEHNKYMEEAKQEILQNRKKMMEERKAAMEAQQKAQMEAQIKAQEAEEKKGMVEEAKVVAAEPGKEAKGAELPKDATVFGD